MKHEMKKKTDAYVRKPRNRAQTPTHKIRIPKRSGRAFDPVAYAAALEVIG
jgi:hypothetical protein